MTFAVEWTATAILNLADILDRMQAESPQGAGAFAAEIEAKASHIASNPKLYRVGRVRGTRECVVTENYLLVYRVVGGVAQILNVVHTRRQWPTSS
ncbi:type II toxin-antitoxin system RelE/ParE family toxin [Burkholderia sp. Bp8963]|uniref:type II toxin-antitoxin system RelE/ParE family toxin n=1 Tax=Burkholderia sp. Bp8963 TaxID=2184547 RepID=UPI000F5A7FFE|nr:type II toxin-antitoxin system RelE/ParE family toxin [Burkholderia sp. Bp8963]RQS68132.1 type II toxin-antitoxin system RelE/ParE family toxin [Burkholderia sp. Bp8963]